MSMSARPQTPSPGSPCGRPVGTQCSRTASCRSVRSMRSCGLTVTGRSVQARSGRTQGHSRHNGARLASPAVTACCPGIRGLASVFDELHIAQRPAVLEEAAHGMDQEPVRLPVRRMSARTVARGEPLRLVRDGRQLLRRSAPSAGRAVRLPHRPSVLYRRDRPASAA